MALIRMKNVPNKPLTIAMFAHECIHAASYIIVSKGMKRGHQTEELQCYIVQHLMEQVLKKVRR